MLRSDAELISRAHHLTVIHYQLQQLLALELPAGFILQGSHDALGTGVKSITSPLEE